MQVIVEIPKTEEQLRRVWGMGFKPTKPTEKEQEPNEDKMYFEYMRGYDKGRESVQPCDDVVSRQAVCDYIAEYVNHEYSTNSECKMVETMIDGIQHIPSVRPQEQTGHWIFDDECKEHGHCSHCGYGRVDLVGGEPHNYCQLCGAKMVEPKERSGEG